MTKNIIWTIAFLALALALFFVYQDNVKLRNSVDLINEAVATSTILTDTAKIKNFDLTWDDSMDTTSWDIVESETGDIVWGSIDSSIDVQLEETSAD